MASLRVENNSISSIDLVSGSLLVGGGEPLTLGAIVLALPVGNLGGIRPKRRATGGLAMVSLESTSAHSEWPDSIDRENGEVIYFGDNRNAAKRAHEKSGNQTLVSTFLQRMSSPSDRRNTPVFFIFSPPPPDAPGRSAVFEGIAVPGSAASADEWCTTRVFRPGDSDPYENVVVRLTLLADRVIRRSWINDLVAGEPLSPNAPDWYRWWVETGERVALCRR